MSDEMKQRRLNWLAEGMNNNFIPGKKAFNIKNETSTGISSQKSDQMTFPRAGEDNLDTIIEK